MQRVEVADDGYNHLFTQPLVGLERCTLHYPRLLNLLYDRETLVTLYFTVIGTN